MTFSNEELESQLRGRDASVHIAYRQMKALERIADVMASSHAGGGFATSAGNLQFGGVLTANSPPSARVYTSAGAVAVPVLGGPMSQWQDKPVSVIEADRTAKAKAKLGE